MSVSTIQMNKETIESLKDIKQYPRQTYDDLINDMIRVYKGVKSKNQYDEFLHKIQQAKMKELWNNKDDEAWDNA